MSDIDFEDWVIGFVGKYDVIGKNAWKADPPAAPGEAPQGEPRPESSWGLARIVLSPVYVLQTKLEIVPSTIHPDQNVGRITRSCAPFLHYFAIDRISVPNVSLVRVKDLTARDQHELREAIKVADMMIKDMRRHDSLHAVTQSPS